MPKNCPKCDSLMEFVESEPDVGIEGGIYVCTNQNCNEVSDGDVDDDPYHSGEDHG